MIPTLRITHVVTVAGPRPEMGGPLRVALDQARELRSRGHDVTLVSGWDSSEPGPQLLEGVPAVLPPARVWSDRYYFSSLFSLAAFRALREAISRSDVVHVHLARDAVPLVAASLAARSGIPYVVQTHGMVASDDRPLARTIDRLVTLRALRGATHRLVLTPKESQDVKAVFPGEMTILRNGVALFDQPGQRNRPTDMDMPEVLFLARLKANKQPLVFAQAAQTLHEQGVQGRFSVAGPDQGELPALRAFIEESRAADYLTYVGPVPASESRRRLAAADIYVLPSSTDPFPVSVLEAMAEGVPTVLSSGCVFSQEIGDAGGAMVVEPTVEGVARGVGSLLSDPAERAALGLRAREVIREMFSISTVVDRLEQVYSESIDFGAAATGRGPGH